MALDTWNGGAAGRIAVNYFIRTETYGAQVLFDEDPHLPLQQLGRQSLRGVYPAALPG